MKKNQSLQKIKKDGLKQGKKAVQKELSTRPLLLIGIDEVGRGPFAGPITMCLFAIGGMSDTDFRKEFQKKNPNLKLDDSKKVKEKDREETAEALKRENYFFVIKSKSAKQIDTLGLSYCFNKIISEMLEEFIKVKKVKPEEIGILLDGGLKAPKEFINQSTHTKGDSKFAVISAASILAKVHRDNYMKKISRKYKEYDFESNKGYGTRKHIEAIKKHGLTVEHRKSFCEKLSPLTRYY